MKLPNFADFLPRKHSEKTHEYLLALQVGKTVTKAATWEGTTDVVIKTVVSAASPTEAIEQATREHPATRVVFGVPYNFVENNKIKVSHLPELKRIASEAHLSPIGFVVIPEAIAHYLEKDTNTPQTCILLGLEDLKLTFSLFRIGKCIKVVELTRTDSIFADMEKGLASFDTEEILPSKIVLYDGNKSLEDLKEQLLSYPWQNNDKFLHVPKIEALPWEYSIKAIVFAGVAENQEDSALEPTKDDSSENLAVGPPSETEQNETFQEKESDELVDSTEPIKISQEESDEETPMIVRESGTTAEKQAQSFGFTVHKTPPTEAFTPRARIHANAPRPKKAWALPALAFPLFTVPRFFPIPRSRGIVPVAIVLVLCLVMIGVTFYTYPKATIALIAEPNVIDNELTITLNTTITEVDSVNNEIPGTIYSVQVDGTTSNETTGKKTIGENASGEVLVYNKSSQTRTLPKGTILSATSVSFTLDSDVTIASASDTGESLTYGKEKAKVTASKIGPQGNLKKDTEFEVGDISKSTIVAKNESDFSGGTEREISMVSKDDQDKLLVKLTENLKADARQKLQALLGTSEQYLDESLKNNIVEKKFDKDIGSESDNISLNLSLEFSQIAYSQDNLTKFFEEYMAAQITDKYTFDAGKSRFDVKKIDQNETGKITFTARYHAYLLPKIDISPFAKEFSGLSRENMNNKVLGLKDQKIVGYDVTYDRRMPFYKEKMPINSRNITVKVVTY